MQTQFPTEAYPSRLKTNTCALEQSEAAVSGRMFVKSPFEQSLLCRADGVDGPELFFGKGCMADNFEIFENLFRL